MSKEVRLQRRGCCYYIRAVVPHDLQPIMKRREIRKSLKTSDHRVARKRVRQESAKIDNDFEEIRKSIRKRRVRASNQVDNGEASTSVDLEDVAFDQASQTSGSNQSTVNGMSQNMPAFAGDKTFLEQFALMVAKSVLEQTGQANKPHDSNSKVSITVGTLLESYWKSLKGTNVTKATHRAYEFPSRILKEKLGEDKQLKDITVADIEDLRDFIKAIPKNATQRFKGLTLKQAIKEADKDSTVERLNERTALNYFNTISGIFAYAIQQRWLDHNPASGRWVRKGFTIKKKKKALFTKEELQKMFKAPLYKGSQDDQHGFAKPGPLIHKRGRYWVPLLGLYHGLRLNEACQLLTEDIKEIEGIPCLLIRTGNDSGEETHKRLKNTASERIIPIHSKLIAKGFLKFVEIARRRKKVRLFDELRLGRGEKFTDPFQKWFARFLKSSLGYEPEATFHSFRHMFRDALRAANTNTEIVESLGGWHRGDRSSESHYGHGFPVSLLKESIEKVHYNINF